MFPNPQSSLPLPPHPDLEQYRKLAKDLVKACKSGDADAAGAWGTRWMETLAAAFGGHVDVVNVLLRHGAPLDVIDETWITPPLVWALHAWGEESMGPAERYYRVVAMLVAAGATVKPACLEYHKVRADP